MTQRASILYCGDTSAQSAAAYLCGICTWAHLSYEYIPFDVPIRSAKQGWDYDLFILSDYPAAGFRPGDFDALTQRVREGAGLIMLGGWESYHGLGGDYHATPLADILPVKMEQSDDRVNAQQPLMLAPKCKHPILSDLPWATPPAIGGYNRISPKSDAQLLLEALPLNLTLQENRPHCNFGQPIPMLIVGQYGQGRTAALATDVAPHWCGTLVDWGLPRITSMGYGAGEVEIGSAYAQFFTQLLNWTMNKQEFR